MATQHLKPVIPAQAGIQWPRYWMVADGLSRKSNLIVTGFRPAPE